MDRWVGRFLQVSGATNSPLLAQAPAGCWDLWDELGVQPKFSLLLQSLSCSVTWVKPQSHSTTKPCFKNSSAYKLGCTDTLQKTCGYLSCCCCSSQAALLQTQNWRCCWLFLKKPAVQKASCHPSKHKIKRRVQFSCMEKRMLIMLVQERKKKALLETPLNSRNLLIAVYLPESTWSINSVNRVKYHTDFLHIYFLMVLTFILPSMLLASCVSFSFWAYSAFPDPCQHVLISKYQLLFRSRWWIGEGKRKAVARFPLLVQRH